MGTLRRLLAPFVAIGAALSRDLDDPKRHSRRGNKRRMGRGDASEMEDRKRARRGHPGSATKRGAAHKATATGLGGEHRRAQRARNRKYRSQIRSLKRRGKTSTPNQPEKP